jgi:general stress protein 26
MATEPITKIDPRFSSPEAMAVPWSKTDAALRSAEVFWVTTVRRDGRPHVVPLLAVWHEGALYFSTGATEQKYRNIESNNHVVLTTGCNLFREGLDVVVEGTAVQTRDETLLHQLAAMWLAKFDWKFEVREGVFHDPEGGDAPVFEVRPSKVLAFGRGEGYTQTRYRLDGQGGTP